ncbi:MAG TPA: glycosyltransferase [Burkholderiales bacterium]|nr:glycosyltransferase [Burkholderiales bacterium]
MLRILQHVKSFHTTRGGVERVVEELVPELNRLPDVEADVLCQGPEARAYALPGKGRVTQAKTDLELGGASLSRGDFRQWVRAAGRYDIVHVHLPWPQSNLNLFLKRFDGAVVVHWHSDIVRQRMLYAGFQWLERWLLHRADRICVTSPKLLAESAGLEGFRGKAVAVPIGMPESAHEIGADEIRALRERHSARTLVFALGRLVPYKGFEHLVRAAALLKGNAAILIGGDGPLAAGLRSLIAQLGVAGKVKLLGALSDRDVELHMRACDVFCLPSVQKSEAFGIVQVEAMRAGRPVVSTRIRGSGVDWVNQDGVTGYTVPVGDAQALAQALNRFAGDTPIARRLGEAARRRYEAHFTARGMAEAVRAVYQSLRL